MTSLFIFLCSFSCFSSQAQFELSEFKLRQLSQHPVWLALLHHQTPTPVIASERFLLSLPDYSPELELRLSVQALLGPEREAFSCRFPARSLWLTQELSLPAVADFPSCKELQLFLQQVPTDKIQLIYAAENINQPSSMMGHSFLNFVGKAADGSTRQHAISFYTELDSINVPQIIFSSLVTGRDAVFMVSPYPEKLRYYQEVEQRNVIEYDLKLTQMQRHLMQLHVWELGQLKLPYYFHRFNCATLTQQLLAISDDRLMPSGWLSPLDVVKHSQQASLIEAQSLEPATRWYLRALQQGLAKPELVSTLIDALEHNTPLPTADTEAERFYLQQISLNYLKLPQVNTELTGTDNTALEHKIRETYDVDQEFYLSLSNENNPLLRPADSQFSVSYLHQQAYEALQLDWQPASHQLSDDNRQLSSESSLQLMALQVRYIPALSDWKLQQFTLYRIQNFIPWDPLSGGISVQFAFGFERQYGNALEDKLTPYLSGGMGRTYQLSQDLQVYALLNGGLARGNGDLHPYAGPELGMFLYEIGDMKSTLSVKTWFNQQGSSRWTEQWSWQQSWFFRPESSLQFQFSKTRMASYREYESMLQLRFYY